ncbi:MAG TPA: hypothetical protein VL737_01145 [Candidatus Pristimantibacillus sp.]|nr:hypothetical protein [Candidatus Pristimantibacillus sp.]
MAVAAETAPYIFVDDIPLVGEARFAERERAMAIIDARNAGVGQGLEQELLPIDALSTADRAHQAAATYGEGSSEHLERLDGLELDCQRLVAEWYRKLRPEWFPETRHHYDADTQSFFSHGMSVRQMTENALVPMPDNPEEQARRVNERVEDETPLILRSLGGIALKGTKIRTISECTDKAIADYAADQRPGAEAKHRGYGGYVPEREKLAIRDIWIDETTGDRFEQQVLVPGEYIEHRIIQMALERRGLDAEHLDKTGLHGAQILASDDIMDFVALLDEVASEQWATNVFMGEEVVKDFIKDYAAFRREAMLRQETQKDLARTVANYVWDLAADPSVDRRTAPAKVEEFVKMLLLDLGKKNPKAAEDMFDKKTADGLREVVRLESIGQYAEAEAKMRQVEKDAPGGGYCGAGSCGIERFEEKGQKAEEVKEKLRAEKDDTLVKDKDRACKTCNTKGGVYYAYSPTKVNKYCDSCGATEYKKTPFTTK